MEEYFEAKRSLFSPARLDRGAVNVDDPYGRRLLESSSVPCVSFGTGVADVRAERVVMTPAGTELVVAMDGGGLTKATIEAHTPLVGRFNFSNCLAAATVAATLGVELDAIEEGLGALHAVPGRFEAVGSDQPFAVIVDYAHTPDSLDNVLTAARAAAGDRGRVIAVFGCGGDRDSAKRPLMGGVAARRADVTIITSDNPRSEDPRAIVEEVVAGYSAHSSTGPAAVVVDRREAISKAVGLARPGDVVVIAGKGHETGQEFADHTIPFDDREVARAALSEAGWEGAA
jgi:UDP-N-acetylmuramoyl-L-alanyl-D-glutamate--2,6-diaminopimelate ligase